MIRNRTLSDYEKTLLLFFDRGNRPSSTLLLDRLTPAPGQLVASTSTQRIVPELESEA